MRAFVTLLVVASLFATLFAGLQPAPAFANDLQPTMAASVLAPPVVDYEALTPLSDALPTGELGALLPLTDPSFHLWFWWVWWTPWGPFLYWWFFPFPW